MKQTFRTLIALCLPFFLCGQVQAQHSGPYVGALLGGNALVDAKSTDSRGDFALTFKPALLGSAVLGWDFEPGNSMGEGRVELEYSHRSNSLDRAKFSEGSFTGEGSMTADSLLFNFFGVVHNGSRWSPYAGVGIGVARVEASGLQVSGYSMAGGSSFVFAYQVGAGVDVALTNRLNLDLGYRYFGSSRPKFTEVAGSKFELDYSNHSAVLGLRVGF